MARRSRLVFLLAAAVAILLIPCADNLFAQDDDAPRKLLRGPGGYFSILKLSLLAGIFLVWVRMADWANRDSMKIGLRTKMAGEFWNPVIVFAFLFGFMIAISIPFFWLAGFPIYILGAFLPITMYFLGRRSKLKEDPNIVHQLKSKPGEAPPAELLRQDEGAEMEFTPDGADKNEQSSNLIRARQTGGFKELKEFLTLTQFKRAEQVIVDYTPDVVNARLLVDGSWHAMEQMPRDVGDAMLASLKHLAGGNPVDRRSLQKGRFKFKSELGKAAIEFASQGTQTGERAQIKYVRGDTQILTLPQLGMLPDMLEQLKTSLNHTGATIISAPPGSGLTTSWQGALFTADRLTRDCVALLEPDERESVLENVVVHRYDQKDPAKKQAETLRAMLLTQPDMICMPKVEDSETMDLMTLQVVKHERAIVFQTPAKSAAEALLRMYAQAGDREQFLAATKNVTCQRLVRRLCDDCKVEVRVQPQVIKQLGGDPNVQQTIFNQWKLPPPEQRVDEDGREIEFPPCPSCGGIGYIGRIAVFELLTLSDQLREFVKKNPKIAPIEQAAVKLGKLPLANQAYKLVLYGVTSLAEVQHVLKSQK
ncbi:MAG: ATPase, T2SS/T4P/T4SS family [Mariniblastus sp.]